MLYGSAGSSAAWSGVDGANAKLMDPDSNSPVLMDVIIFKECAPTSADIRPLEDFLSRFQKKKNHHNNRNNKKEKALADRSSGLRHLAVNQRDWFIFLRFLPIDGEKLRRKEKKMKKKSFFFSSRLSDNGGRHIE